jgi:hypothetical protein
MGSRVIETGKLKAGRSDGRRRGNEARAERCGCMWLGYDKIMKAEAE